MSEIKQTIEDYISAWNSSDSEARMTIMNRILAEKCLYVDSHLPDPIVGRESHCLFIDRFKDKFPDLSLKLIATPDLHHGYFRFNWQIIKADGNLFTQGSFFGEINEENQITKLVGFVD
ncbi:MAG: nuclear transport factor 2 family protein [Pleurocapsa sp.]